MAGDSAYPSCCRCHENTGVKIRLVDPIVIERHAGKPIAWRGLGTVCAKCAKELDGERRVAEPYRMP